MKYLVVRLKRRIVLTSALTALAAASFAALGAPSASAAGHDIGHSGDPTLCLSSPWYQCLLYDASIPTRSAIWGTTATDVNDLAGKTFSMGSGAGNGNAHSVKNNAGGMACYFIQCRSWVNENQTGNYDYEAGVQHGTLFYTWNNEASLSAS